MELLILGDNHGDIENNMTYIDKLKELKIDVIIYTGDFSDVNTPKDFKQEDIAKIIIEELKTLKKDIFAVPGNNDSWEVLDVIERMGINIHGKGKIMGEYGFYGFGGAKTPFKTTIEPSDEETLNGLKKAFDEVKDSKYKIQVTHNPPKKTKVDMIRSGVHVGSGVVRSFIEDKNPILAVSSHIHEAKGVDSLKKSFLINPGRFPEGYFGLVSIKDGSVSGRVLDLSY